MKDKIETIIRTELKSLLAPQFMDSPPVEIAIESITENIGALLNKPKEQERRLYCFDCQKLYCFDCQKLWDGIPSNNLYQCPICKAFWSCERNTL